MAVQGAGRALGEAEDQLSGIGRVVFDTPDADPALAQQAHDIVNRLKEIRIALNGDPLPRRFQEPTLPGIRQRVQNAVSSWSMTAPPTQTQRDAYEYAADAFGDVLDRLAEIIEVDIPDLHEQLDEAGVPWTPGRLPKWDRD